MVLAFIIHTVASPPVRVLYSETFDSSFPTFGEEITDAEEGCLSRSRRKTTLEHVAQRVQGEYALLRACPSSTHQLQDVRAAEKALNVPMNRIEGTGLFRLLGMGGEDKVVVWLCANDLAHVLVLTRDENRMLASNVLKTLAHQMATHCPLSGQPKESLLRPDRINAVVKHFLPDGHLLLMSRKMVCQLEKQLERFMNSSLKHK